MTTELTGVNSQSSSKKIKENVLTKSESEGIRDEEGCYYNTKFLGESWIACWFFFSFLNSELFRQKTCGSNYTNTYHLDLFIYTSYSGSLFIHKPMISLVISKVKNNDNVK